MAKATEKTTSIRKEGWILNSKVAALVIGALSFVVAFAINSTARELFERYVKQDDELQAWAIYTLIVFFVAVLVINMLWRYVK